MPVNYRFKTLAITNFRGIKSLEMDLPDKRPLHLIGSNNSGKSTVLEAIAFALRGGGFHQYDLEPYDFFHPSTGEPANKFDIRLSLHAESESSLPVVQKVGKPIFVHGVQAGGSAAKSGRLSKSFHLLDGSGKPIVLIPRTKLDENMRDELKDHSSVGFAKENARHDEIRDDLPEVMLLTPKNINRSLYEWKTGPLKRLSDMLAAALVRENWSFEYESKTVKMPERIRKSHDFLKHAVQALPLWKDDLKPRLTKTLSEYVGRHTRMELNPQVQTLEEWLQQQILVSFAADESGSLTPLASMGDGWQSLVRLAALDALSHYPDQMKDRVCLLFEEPETHLHPHLHRKMRSILERLAAAGWVVVTTTHSPDLIDLQTRQRIVKLRRAGNVASAAALDVDDTPQSMKLQAKLDQHGNSELLFANKVVLAEGKDDEFAIRTGLLIESVDLDGRSVSVLGVGGKENLPDYAKLLGALAIPWCAVLDEDRKADGTYKGRADTIKKTLELTRTAADRVLEMDTDLEHCFGVARSAAKPDDPEHKCTPEWQYENFAALTSLEVKASFPVLHARLSSVREWVEL